MQERVGVGLPPFGILGGVPRLIELRRRRWPARVGPCEIKVHETGRPGPEARRLAEEIRIEEAVGAVAKPFADQRVMDRRERAGAFAPQAAARIVAGPESASG